ncbi:MAG: glycosyltransferase family 2 protein [Patescibacteria group bacterium]
MKRVTKPLVTVLMAAYNSEKYIAQAIESILHQSLKDFELVIIDDCSRDATWEVIQKYAKKDARITSYRNKTNLKSCQTLINGMKLAKGRYIAIMDHDDWSYPDRLEKQYAFLERHPRVGIVGGTLEITDEKGEITSERRYNLTDRPIREKIFRYSPYAHPLIMIRRSVLQKIGYYNPSFAPADDYELYFRIGEIAEFANLPDKLVKYRVLLNSITNKSTKKMELKTIQVRNTYKNTRSYTMSKSDKIYNMLHYFSLFIIPEKLKLRLFNILRNSRVN